MAAVVPREHKDVRGTATQLRQELDAEGRAAAPHHFAMAALRAAGHQGEAELVADVDAEIGHHPRPAGRDVQHRAIAFGSAVVRADPAGVPAQMSPQLALDLTLCLLHAHDRCLIVGFTSFLDCPANIHLVKAGLAR